MRHLWIFVMVLVGITMARADESTIVHFGPILNETIGWVATAFGTAFAGAVIAVIYRLFAFIGIQTTLGQREQLQSIIVNGLNDAAAKAQIAVARDPRLDIDVKSKIIADAIDYTQKHGADTMTALGLNAKDGNGIEIIKARIATAINDANTPTPNVLDQPLAPTNGNGTK